MKRVLILSLNYYPRFIGGDTIAVKEITDRLPAEEFEFHILVLRFDSELPKEERIGNVIVHRIGYAVPHPSIADLGKFPLHLNKHWYQLAAVWHMSRLHLKYHFDTVWAMMAHAVGIPAGIFKFFNPSVRYVLTLQEGDPTPYIERTMRPVWPLFRQAFVRADELQSISTFLLAWGKRMGFRGAGVLVPNGVDMSKFARTYSADEIATAQKEFGKKPGDVFLVTASRLVQKNAVDDVIRALPLLPAHVSFLVYGIGPDEEILRKLSAELGVTDRVQFKGEVGHDTLPILLKASDIFIRPSRSEGFGNSFIEAMAAEIPVIATQEGGISDFLFDAKRNPDKETTGWAVDVGAPDQIAVAVQEILANPEQVKSVVQTAAAMARATYDWDHVAGRMKALF